MATETFDGSDDEAGEDGYYTAKASKKKEKKRQEREAQRQVKVHTSRLPIVLPLCCITPSKTVSCLLVKNMTGK